MNNVGPEDFWILARTPHEREDGKDTARPQETRSGHWTEEERLSEAAEVVGQNVRERGRRR